MSDFRQCSRCGQQRIPFKLGVCICGNQMGEIKFVHDPERFANITWGVRNPDTRLGIVELLDN